MGLYSRFATSKYIKLRYVIALVLFALVTSGFASLADEMRDGDTLSIDRYILTSIHNNLATPFLDTVMSVGTYFGGVPFLLILTVVVITMLMYAKAYSKALFIGLVMAGTGLANTVLKFSFERQRPELWQQIVQETTFSFPSGHAMGSMAIAATVIVLSWHTGWRMPVVIGALSYVLFIGFSRLYLGVHYPTDILAGWMLSVGWVGILFALLKVKGRNTSVTGSISKQSDATLNEP